MNKHISRRGFLSGSAALSGSALAGMAKVPDAQAIVGFPLPEKPFMDQYYEGMLRIVKGVRDTQIGNISRAAEKAYECKKNGGSVYSHVVYGHYAMHAGSKDRPGQPWVIPQCGISPENEEFEAMKKGDFLISNYVWRGTIGLKERGVYVVTVTNSYGQFYKTKPDALEPGKRPAPFEEVSNLVIDSQVDWRNGLVYTPHFHKFPLFPATGTASMLVYWAVTASLANLIGSKGKGSSSKPAEKYLDEAYERLLAVGTDRPKMDRVGQKWADMILSRNARLLVYGHPQDTSEYDSMNMFSNEARTVSNGTMIAKVYDKYADTLRPEDIVLIGAFTSDNAQEIEVARRARKLGCYTVAFCPFSNDGDATGDRLFKEVDVAFNAYCDESAGVVKVEGFGEKVSPLSGITGNTIHWMLTAQMVEHMIRRGEVPYFMTPLHVETCRQWWYMILPYAKQKGWGLDQ